MHRHRAKPWSREPCTRQRKKPRLAAGPSKDWRLLVLVLLAALAGIALTGIALLTTLAWLLILLARLLILATLLAAALTGLLVLLAALVLILILISHRECAPWFDRPDLRQRTPGCDVPSSSATVDVPSKQSATSGKGGVRLKCGTQAWGISVQGRRTTLMTPSFLSRNFLYISGASSRLAGWVTTKLGSILPSMIFSRSGFV